MPTIYVDSPPKFEYKILRLSAGLVTAEDDEYSGEWEPLMPYLAELGRDGWELVGAVASGESIEDQSMIFKRKI